jgi:hypothetical protein
MCFNFAMSIDGRPNSWELIRQTAAAEVGELSGVQSERLLQLLTYRQKIIAHYTPYVSYFSSEGTYANWAVLPGEMATDMLAAYQHDASRLAGVDQRLEGDMLSLLHTEYGLTGDHFKLPPPESRTAMIADRRLYRRAQLLGRVVGAAALLEDVPILNEMNTGFEFVWRERVPGAAKQWLGYAAVIGRESPPDELSASIDAARLAIAARTAALAAALPS